MVTVVGATATVGGATPTLRDVVMSGDGLQESVRIPLMVLEEQSAMISDGGSLLFSLIFARKERMWKYAVSHTEAEDSIPSINAFFSSLVKIVSLTPSFILEFHINFLLLSHHFLFFSFRCSGDQVSSARSSKPWGEG